MIGLYELYVVCFFDMFLNLHFVYIYSFVILFVLTCFHLSVVLEK